MGMSGSGKSTLINREFGGFERFDDIGLISPEREKSLWKSLADGKPTVVSDIEFCDAAQRATWEERMGSKVEWICFENEPWKCALNCLYRFLYQNRGRPIEEEIVKIIRLTKTY